MKLNFRAVELAAKIRSENKVTVFDKGSQSELYLYGPIGDYFEGGISPSAVIEELKKCKGSSLTVHLLSEGGDVFQARAIYNAIRNFKGPKVVCVDGLAASAATFVMMAGDRVVAEPGSSFMTHGPWTQAMGNAEDLRKLADQLELEKKNIATIYSQKTGKSMEEMMTWLEEEKWFGNEEAISNGFIDSELKPNSKAEGTNSKTQLVMKSPESIARAAISLRRASSPQNGPSGQKAIKKQGK